MQNYYSEANRKIDGKAKDVESISVEVQSKRIHVRCHNSWQYLGQE
jgi:hypothetical protein